MPSIGVNLRVTGHCSQGGRKYMEDFFSVAYQQSLSDERDLEYAFIGIYDGHGGAEAATFAKEHLINLIVNQKLFWSNDDRDVLRAIREGYIATHYAMWREQDKWPKTATGLPSTAGTTASIAFIRHGKIYIGHVGDSGIVLGYQEDGEKNWRARQLTQDHKPECNVEQARIVNSGGKVIVKSGVPRVVWNRPRLGHKGPVRRSTPIDEIPFLAVARSLGDLWSYNSALNEFVVSPNPDVRVIKIDPKRFRCLIFGTDGLWNVVNAQQAVDNVRLSEQLNERNAYHSGTKDWTNPSKSLVDKALERWSTRKMRADNTSVVIIMLDPPGPPKRDVLKSSPTQQYSLDYLASVEDDGNVPSEHLEIEPIENFTMYDHSTNERIDMDGVPMPNVRLAPMSRYENTSSGEVAHQTYMSVMENESSSTDVPYMNSFAESYNSLLNSSLEANQSYEYENDACVDEDFDDDDDDDDDDDETNTTHQFAGSFSTPYIDPTYSLTKLQTRSEQQYASALSAMPSTSHSMYADYHQHNLVDHNYLGEPSTSNKVHHPYQSLASDYLCGRNDAGHMNEMNSGEDMPNEMSDDDDDIEPNQNGCLANQKAEIDPNNITIVDSDVEDESQSANAEDENGNQMDVGSLQDNHLDSSIQINEISSSNNNEPAAGKKLPALKRGKNAKTTSSVNQKATRSSMATTSSTRVTRSTRVEKKPSRVASNQKRPIVQQKIVGRIHKENIVRKIQEDVLTNTSRTRNAASHQSQKDNTAPLGQRTLRSQNAFTKDTTSKQPTNSRSALNHSADNDATVSQSSQSISAKSTSNPSRSIVPQAVAKAANTKESGNSKIIVCKKLPKRLISEPVQIVKSNSSNSSSSSNSGKLTHQQQPQHQKKKPGMNLPLHLTRQSIVSSLASAMTNQASQLSKKSTLPSTSSPPTLRCKVLVTKSPPLVVGRCGDQFLRTINTRRTRLHQ